jgi:hypothetical protein
MHCLVSADKHISSTWAVTRQLLGKQVPTAMDMHATAKVFLDYNNENGVFCVVRAKML